MIFLVLYYLSVVVVGLKVIYDTESSPKTIAYLGLIILVPILGALIYLAIGKNYRKEKIYDKKLIKDENQYKDIKGQLKNISEEVENRRTDELGHFKGVSRQLSNQMHLTSDNNKVTLLTNGENKFPIMVEDLKSAKDHIHMQYYIYDDDIIGNQVADLLCQKAKDGVEVRVIYDDFGAHGIKNTVVKKMREAGVQVAPFYELKLPVMANRLNYRNHRKIVVIDGIIGYVGGINMSDKYDNSKENELYWRDTHIRIEGSAVLNLQHIFISDWNFCAGDHLEASPRYFPLRLVEENKGEQVVQISSSGPDSKYPNIMFALIQAIGLAKEEILITTPYFIPNQSFIDAVKIASISGVDVKILIPGVSDSMIVNAASNSYYEDLLSVGVKIYKYRKGFVHAKTMVCDKKLSFVGTANLDHRSFELNFETNAIIYDQKFANELRDQFFVDLQDADELHLEDWEQRPTSTKLFERTVRMLSPVL